MVVLIGDFDAFLKRKRGQGGGEARGLQPGSWWFTCHLFHLCRIFFFLLVKWRCFVCLTAQNAVRCSLKCSPSVLVTIQPVGKGVTSAGFN